MKIFTMTFPRAVRNNMEAEAVLNNKTKQTKEEPH